MMADPLAEPCPGCGAPDFGTDQCPRCGYDWDHHWGIWNTGYPPDEQWLGGIAASGFKGGSVPGVDQLTPYMKKAYPPTSLTGCMSRYPRLAYYPRLPHQRRILALQQRGLRRMRHMGDVRPRRLLAAAKSRRTL